MTDHILNKNSFSPIEAARKTLPSWMIRINEFDKLEIKPCEIIGRTFLNRVISRPCQSEQADLWTVYGCYYSKEVQNGIEDFEDFNTEAEAEKFRDKLLEAYKHLRSDRPSPARESASRQPTP